MGQGPASRPPRKSVPVGPAAKSGRLWWIIAIVGGLFLLATAGWLAWERPVWNAASATRRALAAGRYDDARKAVGRWLALRPGSADAQFYRAKVALTQGRRDDVADGLTRARALGCPEDKLAVLQALIDAQFGRLAQAQAVLAQAFAEGEPDPMVDEALARIYLEMYDFPHARAVLTRWAKDDPTDARPPLWRAAANRRVDAEPDVVLADYREVLKRDPNHAEARLGLADELARAHRDRDAADAYDSYLADHPDSAPALAGAGRCAIALGDEDAAVRHLDRALALDPENPAANLARAEIDLRRNDPAAALAHLDRAVAKTPFDPPVHYQRSLALKRLGRDDESARERAEFTRLTNDRRALEDLQADLARSPTDARLQSEIARWMFGHGFEKEGVQWARKVLVDHPGHVETCLLLAGYYDRLGDWQQAQLYKAQAGRRP
ncbi:MAG TPA: tetratricopeptide repeat protein [Isosphaeraceae bacterium]